MQATSYWDHSNTVSKVSIIHCTQLCSGVRMCMRSLLIGLQLLMWSTWARALCVRKGLRFAPSYTGEGTTCLLGW